MITKKSQKEGRHSLAEELAEKCNIMSLDGDCPFDNKCPLKSKLGRGLCRERDVNGNDWIEAAKQKSLWRYNIIALLLLEVLI